MIKAAELDSAGEPRLNRLPSFWTLSSAGEHRLHTAGVAGSIPAASTIFHTSVRMPPSNADPCATGLINRPETRRRQFHDMSVRIAEINAVPAARPVGARLDLHAMFAQTLLPRP